MFVISVIFVAISCDRKKQNEKAINEKFIYAKYLLEEGIHETLDPIRDLSRLPGYNDVPDSLLDDWIKRFREPGHRGNKMVSLVYQSRNYNAILVCLVDEVYIDSVHDTKENWYSKLTQFLITVKDDGLYIDGLKVQEYLSKADLDEVFVNGNELMTQLKWSEFSQDTTLVFDKTIYSRDSVLSERRDYIETPDGKKLGIVEMVVSVGLEGTDKTTFIIDSNGKFKKVSEQKGDLKKVSEQTGERIKPAGTAGISKSL